MNLPSALHTLNSKLCLSSGPFVEFPERCRDPTANRLYIRLDNSTYEKPCLVLGGTEIAVRFPTQSDGRKGS